MGRYPTGQLIAGRLSYDEGYELMLVFEITNGPPNVVGTRIHLHCKPLDEVLLDIEALDGNDDDEEDDEEESDELGWDDALEDDEDE